VSPPATGWDPSSHQTEARTLGLGFVVSGLVSLATAVVPFSDTAPTALAAGVGLLGLALGTAVRRAGPRVPRVVLHGLLAFTTTVMTLLIVASTTDVGRVVTAYGYLWPAMFTAWFHPRRAAAAHLAAIGAGFGVALAVSDAPSAVQTWGFVSASVAGVAVVLNRLVASLRSLAERDPLTGLLTRPAFASAAERYMTLAQRSEMPLSLVVIDLDDFKTVNDRHGHAAGDAVLSRTAAAWSGAIRRGDVLGRHGGDEFVLLMPATTHDDARQLLGRLYEVSATGWSAGIASWDGDDLASWLRRADVELYADKQTRRGEVR
jgi:diguanylate cyclase (GGDEF)-like protein